MEQQKRSFEQSLTELEAIVAKLESGNIPLEEMVSLYEQGTAIGKECMALLDGYEGRLTTLETKEAGDDQ